MKRQKAVVLAENQTAGRADEETNLVRLDRCPKVAGPWVEHSADNQLGDAGVAKGDGSQFRSGLAAGRRPGPRSRKGVSVLAEGKRGKGHGDDKRRSRDGEYPKRNRGFESGSLQRRVHCELSFGHMVISIAPRTRSPRSAPEHSPAQSSLPNR